MKHNRDEIFTSNLSKILSNYLKKVEHPIFVLSGITDYVDFKSFGEHLADSATFDEDGNSEYFDRIWFARIFTALNMPSDYTIISHQQYAYLVEYLNVDFFKDRIVVVYDNLRTLYPLDPTDYIEDNTDGGVDLRPEGLPIYQAEQFKIGDKCYFSLRQIEEAVAMEPFFKEKKSLEESSLVYSNEDVVDVTTNPYAIDLLINKCIERRQFDHKLVVKLFPKQPLNKHIQGSLEQANYILSIFGGGIFIQHETSINNEYEASKDALRLLHKYWGRKASFRDILIYENPDYGNATKAISQGQIVDTIINEYNVGKQGKTPRDIFITAPTGAGKSLIFQLPSFYAAEKGDMTIVVSPLKALMTDQVINLQKEHGYYRVAYINSDLTFIDRESIIDRCKDGEIDILYLSPELLLSYDIKHFIGERSLGLLIIDEAHLITTWGRDFRVDYWFLGNHINKIKKFGNYKFPLVALTATAVYGGTNDMVFDSISSLYMHDPHKFIGEVRRNNIEFVFDTHDDYSSGKYDANKEDETVKFIQGVAQIGCKTIVYAPYRRHIDLLDIKVKEKIGNGSSVVFHGGLSADAQAGAYSSFRNNQSKVMICTKAFGMGIDIPDIECVYHHAPSGLLPDYIQEIGRAARKKEIHGFAALTFSPSDLRYSKQLFGISSIKTFQIRAILQKIYSIFLTNKRKRNMLVSANDFAYIFSNSEDVGQKVLTALMMIEKDYLIKYRFNVVIARPKSLFSQVFARTTSVGLARLTALYGDCFTVMNWKNGDFHYLQLNLDKIWMNHFCETSFPKLKNDFYTQKFLSNEGIELTPLLKISFFLEKEFQDAISRFTRVLNAISLTLSALQQQGSFFSEKEFKERLVGILGASSNVDKLAAFILASYSARHSPFNTTLEGDAFLQRRSVGFIEEYQVFNSNYEAKFAQLKNRFASLFPNEETTDVCRFVSINEAALKNYIRLGALFEILGIGSYVSLGGEDPKLFIRINDPRKLERDSQNVKYSNFILESVKNRHRSSCQIFEHFFTNFLDNESRWNLIEDFFLGASTDDLLSKYSGGTRNRVDIIKYITNNRKEVASTHRPSDKLAFMQEFKPRQGGIYNSDCLLTIGKKTLKISRWVNEDPVLLHRTMCQYNISIQKDIYVILISRLKAEYKEYYRDIMGLRLIIQFKGYKDKVQAVVPYKDQPVKFYKWWKTNQKEVTLAKKEIIDLFLRVEQLDPKALTKAHRAIIEK